MESAVPPSYEEATARDYLSLVAPYIGSSDLCSAALVSKSWHAVFEPCLWGNPASHFGTENDRVYGRLSSHILLSQYKVLIDNSFKLR